MPHKTTANGAAATAAAGEIAWADWGEEAFARARREDKLILLDSGATWCHWCHVMDRLTYEDAEVIRLVNERFIAVRIDRDRLPDVDACYQRAAPLVESRGNGWPLTVVITPEGYTLYKATFLPPRAGGPYVARIGLVELLQRLDRLWRTNRERVNEAGAAMRERSAEQFETAFTEPGEVTGATVDEVAAALADGYDAAHGGFGSAPKFFTVGGLEMLLVRAWAGDTRAREMLAATLDAMARGGVYDQVGGGFHRYSVDARWHVPHFEKMAADNAALLALYANAHALTGRHGYARLARQTRQWIARVLTDPDTGGFYASQDADVGGDDDGDYFTWTIDEARAALGEQAKVALAFYAIDDEGDVHGRPGRNVLHVPKSAAQVARLLDMEEQRVTEAVAEARRKLLAAREQRQAPAVDKTIFADLNGMLIDAHLTMYERLGEEEAKGAAIAALRTVLDTLRGAGGVFAHFRENSELRRPGLLADQAWMARALLHAYAVTLERRYLDAALRSADSILAALTADDGGFLSRPASATTRPAAVAPSRSWDDSPGRSAASVAAQMLLDLGHVTGEGRYAVAARKALASFAGGVSRQWGLFFGGYAVAAEHSLHGPRTIVVAGAGPAANALAGAARRAYVPGGLVMALRHGVKADRAILGRLIGAAGERPAAYVCRGTACLAPAYDPEDLRGRLSELAQGD